MGNFPVLQYLPHAVVDGSVPVEVHELVGYRDQVELAFLLIPGEANTYTPRSFGASIA